MAFGDPHPSIPYTSSYQGRSSTITRMVPQKCQVCKGLTKAKKADCEVCEGKGWLWIAETETSWGDTYTAPYLQPYTPTYPSYPSSPTIAPPLFPGQTICQAD